MSMETLLSDLKANLAELGKLSALSSPSEIVQHLKEVLWPTVEAIVEEMKEIDDTVYAVVNGEDDILQPETGAIFAAVVAAAVTVATALKARITPSAEPELFKICDELLKNCKAANDILEEVVLEDVDDDDDSDEGDESDDEDDGDDE